MNYLPGTSEPYSAASLNCKKEAQKYLIEFILNQGSYDLQFLAELLDVNVLVLSDVLRGKDYLNKEAAAKLVEWFLLFIGVV